jgi:KUP system potassium uptake protein
MATWRQHLFPATSRLTTDAAEAFGLPPERTLILGSRVEI